MEDEAILRDELKKRMQERGKVFNRPFLYKKKITVQKYLTEIYGSKAETNLSMTLYQEGGQKIFRDFP